MAFLLQRKPIPACSMLRWTSHGTLPWHTRYGVSWASITKWCSSHLELLITPTKFLQTVFSVVSGTVTQQLSSLRSDCVHFPLDIGYSQPCVCCHGFRGILLQLLKSLQNWPHIEFQCGRCLSLQKTPLLLSFIGLCRIAGIWRHSPSGSSGATAFSLLSNSSPFHVSM